MLGILLFLQLYIEDRSFVQNRVSYYLLCFTVDILSRMKIVDYSYGMSTDVCITICIDKLFYFQHPTPPFFTQDPDA